MAKYTLPRARCGDDAPAMYLDALFHLTFSRMKRGLLLFLLLGAAGSAQAQLVQLISLGTRLGAGAAVSGIRRSHDARSDAAIAPARYRGQEYDRKRTPANKLKGIGGDQIAYQESLLDKCQAAMLADSTAAIGNADLWATLQGSLEVIAQKRPAWNTQAYASEAAFYQAEDARRQRVAQPAAH
jgi:hypothetical protein